MLGGCGESAARRSTATSTHGHEVVPDGSPGSVALQKGDSIPLGLTPNQVVRRLGEPATPLHRKDTHFRCMFYNIVGQPPTVQLQYCFRGGKLKVLASYIRR